jgi:hypothetical protein|tara:strand:- start:1163 stop:1909 length:747 start_codon:yes stop_codon:yes gene_type:complete
VDINSNNNLKNAIEKIINNYNTRTTYVNGYHSDAKREQINNYIKELSDTEDWLVYVDIDEFINLKESPGIDCIDLPELIRNISSHGLDGISGIICDKFCISDLQKEITTQKDSLSNFSHYYPFTKLCSQSHKLPLFKCGANFRFTSSHCIKGKIRKPKNLFLVIDHYKWNKDTIEKLKKRLFTYKKDARKKFYMQQKKLLEGIIKNKLDPKLTFERLYDKKMNINNYLHFLPEHPDVTEINKYFNKIN